VLKVVPIATIAGQTVLSGAAMERQLRLGHSVYIVTVPDTRIFLFLGLNQVSDDGNSGDYYWRVMYLDDKVGEPDHWLQTASSEARLDYVKKAIASLDPRFRELIESTPTSGVSDAPSLYLDAEIPSLPAGRVALLGDAAHPMTPCEYCGPRIPYIFPHLERDLLKWASH
jgi:2-polyprenyl-6-methoxyphenol hydroxylase-like FAD-dependent oxidoreductase